MTGKSTPIVSGMENLYLKFQADRSNFLYLKMDDSHLSGRSVKWPRQKILSCQNHKGAWVRGNLSFRRTPGAPRHPTSIQSVPTDKKNQKKKFGKLEHHAYQSPMYHNYLHQPFSFLIYFSCAWMCQSSLAISMSVGNFTGIPPEGTDTIIHQ